MKTNGRAECEIRANFSTFSPLRETGKVIPLVSGMLPTGYWQR